MNRGDGVGSVAFSKVCPEDLNAVVDSIGCGFQLAYELLVIAGGDVELVVEAAREGGKISITKAKIIDARLNCIEQKNGIDNCGCQNQDRRDLHRSHF